MHFYPAIDIKEGKFIRLIQGRLDEVTIYGNNPVEIAMKFSDAGAKWIHVVDIDGRIIGAGKKGPLTLQLQEIYAKQTKTLGVTIPKV